MDIFSVVLVTIGSFLLIITIEKPNNQYLKGLAIFICGFGLGFLILIIVRNYPINISVEQNYYLQNWGVFVALITAIGALSISIWQGFEARSANRKQVFPNIAFFRDNFDGKETPSISMINKGIGPARIEDFNIFVGGKRLQGADNQQRFDNFILILINFRITEVEITVIRNDSFVQVGEKIDILTLRKIDMSEYSIEFSRELFKKITFEVTYSDIYGNKFSKSMV